MVASAGASSAVPGSTTAVTSAPEIRKPRSSLTRRPDRHAAALRQLRRPRRDLVDDEPVRRGHLRRRDERASAPVGFSSETTAVASETASRAPAAFERRDADAERLADVERDHRVRVAAQAEVGAVLALRVAALPLERERRRAGPAAARRGRASPRPSRRRRSSARRSRPARAAPAASARRAASASSAALGPVAGADPDDGGLPEGALRRRRGTRRARLRS